MTTGRWKAPVTVSYALGQPLRAFTTKEYIGGTAQGRRRWRDSGQQLAAARKARLVGVAYDTELADRIRFLIGATPGVTEKKMFGGLAFLVGVNMAITAQALARARANHPARHSAAHQ